ncbi:NAD-dependent epimerase/dehydratase family protein [Algibacter mikhailovii]|uniref:NAD-dependent epimerase n=1 Tax=Algibacter mikhailovii TaxID=425498 RepID=A0A918R374_9FLAO|nr:NAD-dependent epimerase/dehydratase family protein [Algibacter mikhailovii]GGZ85033.1 NAD-dependent epimerase [Algibacter mikhailovii]
MILVTGGTGLVGAHLLYKLTSGEEKIRAIYRNDKKLENTKNVFSYYTKDYETAFESIEWVKADLLDIPALSNAFKGITRLYHCAAFVSFEPDKYPLLRKTNIEGTANIVNLSISNNIDKLCYVSSIATLGTTLDNSLITEDTIWEPEADNNVYAITKYGAEIEVWRGTQEGLNAVIVNPGVILGAGIWKYGSGSIFKKAAQGLKFYTKGTVGLIAVEDVVNIMIALMDSKIINERYILIAENWSFKKFLQAVAKSINRKVPTKTASQLLLNIAWRLDWVNHKVTGKRRQLTKHLAKSLSTESCYSNNKIKTALAYKFKSIEETITAVGQAYQK